MNLKKVLTVAGSDSGAGAGIQADLKTFSAMGVYGLNVLTAVTAQNTASVTGIHVIPPEFVAKQITALFEDMEIAAVKTGMLVNVDIIDAVCEQFIRFKAENIVVDPVMIATSGDHLIDEQVENFVEAIRNRLLPLAFIVTPNIPEAEILTGRKITGIVDMKVAAAELQGLGVPNVVIKGGHLNNEDNLVDLLFDGNEFVEYIGKRVLTQNTHGTGCTFASAVAAGLALGKNIKDVVGDAKRYVSYAMEYSYSIGRSGGPLNHFAGFGRLGDDGE
ncbi:bifunctional hydroxymethylpyrimidine kinase/phosphomethylpyrimidine kinase [Phosphitispora sp. TUW77]|uniref:bifunctional hydroxymethylpyrimidine kinase/phosphomethylpyrimidine kinase n=1 Tax=Phosphitispora sp. TUW77 TaxID=3152361 RepID=UPI003AB4AFCD